jgi:adenylyltransferase/sulfurtransferase
MKEISVQELKAMLDAKEDFQLIDVRRKDEYEFANLGGELIVLDTITKAENVAKIARDKKVVVHCRSGARSANAIQLLEQLGFDNLYNLKGGILAYAREIDNSIPTY